MHVWRKTYKSEKYDEMREVIDNFNILHGKKDQDEMVSKRAKPACKFCSDKICLCKLLKVPENRMLAMSQRGPGEEEEEYDEEEDDESIFSFEYEMKEYNDYIDHLTAYYHVKDEAQQKKNREEEQ